MFNWLKKLFVRQEEQSYVIFHIIYVDEPDENPVKQKRKYVRSGKYVGKFKSKNKKGKK